MSGSNARSCTSQVRFVREGGEGSELFFHLLLDEPDAAPAAESGGGTGAGPAGGGHTGLVQFLEHIRQEVLSALRLEAAQQQSQQTASKAAS